MSTGDRIEVDVDADTDGPSERCPAITASRCSPDRTVFTEQDNTDAWIATNLTVEPQR